MSSDSIWVRGQVAVLRHCGKQLAAVGHRPDDGTEPAKMNLLGPNFWEAIRGRSVLDFGCGTGIQVIQLAQRGARRVIGLDIQERFLAEGRRQAELAGVADKCVFVSHTDETADHILSLDAFEHFGDPEGVLNAMARLLHPGGSVWISFGPVWRHPRGGHLFSVFPWAHLMFQEKALIAWRSEFTHDGARRFSEVAGGLNQMTIRRFRQVVQGSGFRFAAYDEKPIRAVRHLHNRLTREYFTSVIVCRLVRA